MTQTNDQKSLEQTPSESTSSLPLSRKKLLQWGAAGLIVVMLAVGIPKVIHTFTHTSTDDAFIDGSIVPVSSRISGHVAGIHVNTNQWVNAGDLLVELDPRDFQTGLDAAQAALEAAEAVGRSRNAALELTEISATSGLDEATESLESAKAAVQEAQSQLVLSRATYDLTVAEAESARARHDLDVKDLKRYREMAQTQTITIQDLDRAETAEQISAGALVAAGKRIDTQKAKVAKAEAAVKAAQANLRKAEARLNAARSIPQQMLQSRSQTEVSHADINQAKAKVEQARLSLSYTKIFAPTDGYITKKGIEIGQFVRTGQSLMALVSRDIWVTANFKETQLTDMRPGQPVDIAVDAFPDFTLLGHVESIQHGTGSRFSLLPPENATGNFVKVVQRVPVKIVFDNLDESAKEKLAPGMSVIPDVNIRHQGWPDKSRQVSKNSTGTMVKR